MAVFLLTSGCAGALAPPPTTVPEAPARELGALPAPVEPEAPEATTQEPADGVIHVVQAGQTLWRIAHAYDVPLDVVAAANGITDPTKVEIGTPVFIPGARSMMMAKLAAATADVDVYLVPANQGGAGGGAGRGRGAAPADAGPATPPAGSTGAAATRHDPAGSTSAHAWHATMPWSASDWRLPY
jgi:LysM repeat protein